MIRSAFVVGMMILLAACHAPQEEEEAPNTTAAHTHADTVDSLQRDDVAPGPAPGTARARVTVQDCEQHTDDYQCQIEIREVIAYGSSTPVLEAGSIVEVRIPDGEAALRGSEELDEETEVEVTLSHEERPAMEEAPTSAWRLEAIHVE